MDTPHDVQVANGATATADLKLVKTRDLAAQLSNSEWLASFPGTEQQKASIRACTHCHTLERVARSRYDVDKLTSVIERMSSYPQLSFPMKVIHNEGAVGSMPLKVIVTYVVEKGQPLVQPVK